MESRCSVEEELPMGHPEWSLLVLSIIVHYRWLKLPSLPSLIEVAAGARCCLVGERPPTSREVLLIFLKIFYMINVILTHIGALTSFVVHRTKDNDAMVELKGKKIILPHNNNKKTCKFLFS